jgi:PhzF family phenazine biosynthesis protein
MQRRFRQVDVFAPTPFGGNPKAVVLDAGGLSTSDMQRSANWTNLSIVGEQVSSTQPGRVSAA